MTRWLLATTLLFVAFSVMADEPKKPATAGKEEGGKKEEAKKEDGKDEPSSARIAHIKLSGSLDESPVADSLFGPPGENLRMKLDRIRKAAKDERIKGLYLDIKSLSIGFGKLNELRTAIAEFRATGKKAFVYAEELGTKEYLLALCCDQVVIPESGGINVFGLRAEVTYYKNALDMVKLKADVLKMGDYKSAVEPYLTDKMSRANREQLESLLDDNYEKEIIAGMIQARPAKNWTPDQVKAVIDQGPFTAKKASSLGLVDQLAYEDQFQAIMAKQLGVEEVRITQNYGKAKGQEMDFSNPFKLLEALSPPKKPKENKEPKIAVIYAVGGINSGKSGSGNPLMGGESVGSETLVEAIREADKNPTVKAIVLRIDSPGGSALASDMIWRALKQCKKPVIASMGDVAASGGYYIAMAGKKIYCEPGTITGSIGVFGLKLVTGGLEDWAGMKTEVVSRGKNSGITSTTFAWSDSERKAMTDTIVDVYAQFIDKSLEGRKAAGVKMTREELVKLAGGRVWTGRQAKAAGLVDELGTLDDAIAAAKKSAGIDPKQEMELLILPKGNSFLDKLADGDVSMPFGALKMIPGTEKALKMAAPLLRTQNEPLKMLMPFNIEWK